MRILLAAAAVLAAQPLFAADLRPARSMPVLNPNQGASTNCPATSRYEAARRGGKLPKSLLTELPAADLYKAVYRRIGGCEVPIIAGYDIGGRARAASTKR